MISGEEALRILHGWRRGAVKFTFSTETVGKGILKDATQDEIRIVSDENTYVISTLDTTFRLVPRTDIKMVTSNENWSEAVEIHLPSGAFVLLLKLSDKPVAPEKSD